MKPCSFCGEVHDPGPVGEAGTWLEAIPVCVCPRVPTDHIYVDMRFATGPPGILLSVAELHDD